ncbi:MAG: hemerythrin domain-containing protein [Alphaproteobacteria bacterium]|nr:hemerythrin domain-containing protein [Alphaproteobacteria bacterium]MBF0250467.1 hemerythrin domain-containing protein [Alphaproteobacteria bacterium]
MTFRKLELPEALKTGHAVIDAQHARILDAINRILERINMGGRNREALEAELLALSNEVRSHFHDEERLLAQMGYSDLKAHRSHHTKTLRDLDTIQDIFAENVLPAEWIIHTIIHLFISDVTVPDSLIARKLAPAAG